MILKITIFAADQWTFLVFDNKSLSVKFSNSGSDAQIFRTAQIGRLNFNEHGWYFAFRWISKTLILAGTWCIFWVAITVLNFYKTKDWNDRLQFCHWYRLFLMFLKITIFAADQWPFFALDKTHTLQKFEGRALRFWIFRTAQIGRLNFYEHGWYFAFRWISKTLRGFGDECAFVAYT